LIVVDEEVALDETDVRAVVRLLGEVAILEGGMTAKRQRLMNGLAELVGADGWLWTMSRVDVEQETPMSVGLIHGGLNDRQIAAWAESSQEQIVPLPEHRPLTELVVRGEHFTRTRRQLVTDSEWYAHPTVRAYRFDVGLDDFLYSIYPLEPGVISAIGLYRERGREAFSARQRRLVHIVTSEVKWLHWGGLPEDRGRSVPALSPRLRAVLVLMLEGHARKRVASLLGISVHTVGGHVKALYKHFGVSSQAELMRRFRVGDGGDGVG
jgi:DNA-binding CsgD family transcriptional regulator